MGVHHWKESSSLLLLGCQLIALSKATPWTNFFEELEGSGIFMYWTPASCFSDGFVHVVCFWFCLVFLGVCI